MTTSKDYDFLFKLLIIGDSGVGQERFRTITTTYYRGTHGVIVVYDVNSTQSFSNVKKWLEEIRKNCEAVPVLLVGNKDDEPGSKSVPTRDGRDFASVMEVDFIETSAKENKNIDECFLSIARLVLENKLNQANDEQNKEKINLSNNGENRKKKRDCC
ncbi:DgyrCDS10636 [Dimorphilus gyrociliatus]|uniref:DgyrCDS10636 n=1 Tax=Dimorphilus gyrociliatus TaxID=2664684 RepID=A0A7I8W0U6_9ANNE|nr:DgyrCDS10636 [Dimorphilus gyrociliatus]